MLKLYQYEVLAGFLLALVGLAPIHAGPAEGLQGGFEAASFLLCCAGVLTGGQAVRVAFEERGRDRSVAARDPEYMKLRSQVQLTALIAAAAVGLLIARRNNVPWFLPLAAAAALAVSLPLINRLTGWRRLQS